MWLHSLLISASTIKYFVSDGVGVVLAFWRRVCHSWQWKCLVQRVCGTGSPVAMKRITAKRPVIRWGVRTSRSYKHTTGSLRSATTKRKYALFASRKPYPGIGRFCGVDDAVNDFQIETNVHVKISVKSCAKLLRPSIIRGRNYIPNFCLLQNTPNINFKIQPRLSPNSYFCLVEAN